MTNTDKIQANNAELRECIEIAENLPERGGGTVTLQEKTVTPTKSQQEVNPDSGFGGLSKVTIQPIPSNFIEPSGVQEITENGDYDVTASKTASVNVPIPEGYIKPSGTKEITENGTHDVREFESVNVAVASSGGSDKLAKLVSRTIEEITAEDLQGATIIGRYSFFMRQNLKRVTVPNSITEIETYAFYNNILLEYIDFTACTSIPTLASTGMENLPSSCRIRVSAALYDEWIQATNWSSMSWRIVAV